MISSIRNVKSSPSQYETMEPETIQSLNRYFIAELLLVFIITYSNRIFYICFPINCVVQGYMVALVEMR